MSNNTKNIILQQLVLLLPALGILLGHLVDIKSWWCLPVLVVSIIIAVCASDRIRRTEW